MSIQTILPCALHALTACGRTVDLIDVRTPAEFGEVHASYARNVPLDALDPAEIQRGRSAPAEPLYVICRSGARGKQACENLVAAGVEGVVNVEGGTLAWIEAGLPVERGKKAVSLERQVRIAAGGLVLLGLALGWWVHPALFGLSAFVGAGLVYAGITDRCGMALLLGRAPWNRAGNTACQQPRAK